VSAMNTFIQSLAPLNSAVILYKIIKMIDMRSDLYTKITQII
jgi:hypothetical protein